MRRNLFADEEAIETILAMSGYCDSRSRRNLFADEEAIETLQGHGGAGSQLERRNLFADEEAIETGTLILFTILHKAGTYSLTKKRLRPEPVNSSGSRSAGRNLFADEEAIETYSATSPRSH